MSTWETEDNWTVFRRRRGRNEDRYWSADMSRQRTARHTSYPAATARGPTRQLLEDGDKTMIIALSKHGTEIREGNGQL